MSKTRLDLRSTGKTISLSCTKQNIVSVPDNVLLDVNEDEIQKIDYLDFSNNSISELGSQLSGVAEQLRVFDLSSNSFKVLPDCVTQLCKNLTSLYLKDNLIESLPESFENLKMLEELSLSNNQLTEFPSLQHLNYLSVLDLSHNKIKEIKRENLPAECLLEEFSMHHNEITEIPESIGLLPNLIVLNLNNNQISSVPESFSSLKQIQEIHLAFNNLSRVPLSLGRLTDLLKFDLTHNRMACPPSVICAEGCASILSYLNQLSSPTKEKTTNTYSEIIKTGSI